MSDPARLPKAPADYFDVLFDPASGWISTTGWQIAGSSQP